MTTNLTLTIHFIRDKQPTGNWSPLCTEYSRHCLVWNGSTTPSFAMYHKPSGIWYVDDAPANPTNWIDDVEYWAEIPEMDYLSLQRNIIKFL